MTSTTVAAPTRLSADVRAVIFLLSLAGFFSGVALRICDALIPRLASDFGISAGTAGQVMLTYSIAYGLSQLASGPLGDRWGKVQMVCASVFGCALAAFLCALVNSFAGLLAIRAGWGIAAAGLVPLSIAWVGDTVAYEQRQATLAKMLMGMLVGMTAGQAGGGLFADSALGWRGAFTSVGAGFLIVGVLLAARLRSIPSAAPLQTRIRLGVLKQIAAVVAVPWARVVLAGAFVEGVFLLGPLAYLPAFLHGRFGVSLSRAGMLVSLYAAGGFIYALLAPKLVRRLGEARMVGLGGAFMGAGFLGLYLTPLAALAAPICLAIGFGTYLYHNTLQTNATQMVPAWRGTAMSCFASCLFSGQAIGVSLGGFAFDHGGPLPLLLGPAIALPAVAWAFARRLAKAGKE
jgi:predicted MFS family arabinose efflux permease